MNRILAAPLLVALAAASPSQPVVQVATGDWSQLPQLQPVSYDHLSMAIMTKVYQIGREHRCRLPGQSGNRIDMSISFAAQFGPDGQLTRLLVPAMNCPEAEVVDRRNVGQVAAGRRFPQAREQSRRLVPRGFKFLLRGLTPTIQVDCLCRSACSCSR